MCTCVGFCVPCVCRITQRPQEGNKSPKLELRMVEHFHVVLRTKPKWLATAVHTDTHGVISPNPQIFSAAVYQAHGNKRHSYRGQLCFLSRVACWSLAYNLVDPVLPRLCSTMKSIHDLWKMNSVLKGLDASLLIVTVLLNLKQTRFHLSLILSIWFLTCSVPNNSTVARQTASTFPVSSMFLYCFDSPSFDFPTESHLQW